MLNDVQMRNRDLLTIKEASKLLGETRPTTARRVASGQLSSTQASDDERAMHLLQREEVIALALTLADERRGQLARMEAALAEVEKIEHTDETVVPA